MQSLFAILFFIHSFAQAESLVSSQDGASVSAMETQKSESTAKSIEKIQVTGSYIKRIQAEGPSPMVTMDSELFEQTGNQTLSAVSYTHLTLPTKA